MSNDKSDESGTFHPGPAKFKPSMPLSGAKTGAEREVETGPDTERRSNKRDIGEDKAAQLAAIKKLLGNDHPLAFSNYDISAEDLASLEEEMKTDFDCVEVARLKYLSEHDELTGQKNRIKLHEALESEISKARKDNIFCSFLITGINNLSIINDTFGYQLGDEVISSVAYELAKALRKHDVIGHYSTNKFGLILPCCGPDALHLTMKRLIAHIGNTPVMTSKGLIPLTISIGGVVMPQFASNAQEAVSRSLEALDQAKRHSANSYRIYEYSSERDAHRQRNLQLSREIISALNEKRMRVALQPIVCAKSRDIAHYETLLVMECGDGEMISAGEFLPVAEKLGLCRLIDFRTLELGIELLKNDPALNLTLNVSSTTTNDSNWLIAMRSFSGRDRSIMERLTVEITETVSIQDIERTASFVSSLRELGCGVAIDDFGTGYSSFHNLRALDANLVKIDGDFIKNIIHSPVDQIFVKSLVALARDLNMETVAEWVRDEETANYLNEIGVDYFQGYLFGKPVVVEEAIIRSDDEFLKDVDLQASSGRTA